MEKGITNKKLSTNFLVGKLKFNIRLARKNEIRVTKNSATNCDKAVAFSANLEIKIKLINKLMPIPIKEMITMLLSFLCTLKIRSTKTCAKATISIIGAIIWISNMELMKFFPASNMIIGLAKRKTKKVIGIPNVMTTFKDFFTNIKYSSSLFSSKIRFNRGIITVIKEEKTEMTIRIILLAP